jgi:hypothetical protein
VIGLANDFAVAACEALAARACLPRSVSRVSPHAWVTSAFATWGAATFLPLGHAGAEVARVAVLARWAGFGSSMSACVRAQAASLAARAVLDVAVAYWACTCEQQASLMHEALAHHDASRSLVLAAGLRAALALTVWIAVRAKTPAGTRAHARSTAGAIGRPRVSRAAAYAPLRKFAAVTPERGAVPRPSGRRRPVQRLL